MPLYAYECDACKNAFESRHSVKETLEKCTLCGVSQMLRRIPFAPVITKKKKGEKSKIGELVNKAIEEGRENMKKEKNKRKEYEQ